MIRVSQIKLPVGHSSDELKSQVLRLLHADSGELLSFSIVKRSIDARKKPQLYYVYTVDVTLRREEHFLRRKTKASIQKSPAVKYVPPRHGDEILEARPVVIGSGPAGLFCAYLLAEEGYRPLVLERGASVRERQKDVENFWKTGVLDTESNVQFGEGGAGTFSDGKLNTLVKDSCGRNRYVLETFVSFGAPKEILYEQKPHIGTDVLIETVERMRSRIIELGGQFRFHAKVTDIFTDEKAVCVNGEERVPCGVAVLALGHSARDTFHMLYEKGFPMEAKSFAVGVRIEHSQEMIDMSQYGRSRGEDLPSASYKLTEQLENGRGAYTFCMCPGGYVVNASSEDGMLAVNGMSYHDRDGENANSAVIVTVTPRDYGSDTPLAGVEFQRRLERRAWEAGNGAVPVQRFEDYRLGRVTESFGKIKPAIKGAYVCGDVRGIFPDEIGQSIEEGIIRMGRKIRGFDGDDAVLSGVESRTSSPLRIVRDGLLACEKFPWVYPCGEGAGYAGGITSAAMDGLKIAEAIIRRYRANDFTEY